MLFDSACESITAIHSNNGAQCTDMKTLIRNIIRFNKIITAFTRRKRNIDVVRHLIADWGHSSEWLKDRNKIDEYFSGIKKHFAEKHKNIEEFSYEIKEDDGVYHKINCISRKNGDKQVTTSISKEMYALTEYEELCSLSDDIKKLGDLPYKISTDGGIKEFNSLDALVDFIMEEGKKGYSIQRYKGLGEMNPEQLWETTMNPENRMMIKVSVNDALEADRVFTILMGDVVEPRRQFIEENALRVRNLDI